MTERELQNAVEVLPERLFWVALTTTPKNTLRSHYFSVDDALVYEPFFADFGPLNLAMVYRYCRMVDALMVDPLLKETRLIHYCSCDPKKRANAAFLIGAYQVVQLRTPAEAAFAPFKDLYPPFLPFRDASHGPCNWHLTIEDCLQGLEFSIQRKWFDWQRFDVDSYEYFERVENGDMNWIIPERFIAFAGPALTSSDADGYQALTPEDYVPIFREAGVGLVVRLNKKQYDRRRFIDHGVKHLDLFFTDGSCPPSEVIGKFLHVCENEPSAIGVHCKAGLGRTGTLIGLYAMKHYKISARAFVGWNRICRPGSILGPQQAFLCDMEKDMFQAGAVVPSRPPPGAPYLRLALCPLSLDDDDDGAADIGRWSVFSPTSGKIHEGESFIDSGQGERLIQAKLQSRRSTPSVSKRSTPTASLSELGAIAVPDEGTGSRGSRSQVPDEGTGSCGTAPGGPSPRLQEDSFFLGNQFAASVGPASGDPSAPPATRETKDGLGVSGIFAKGLRGVFSRRQNVSKEPVVPQVVRGARTKPREDFFYL